MSSRSQRRSRARTLVPTTEVYSAKPVTAGLGFGLYEAEETDEEYVESACTSPPFQSALAKPPPSSQGQGADRRTSPVVPSRLGNFDLLTSFKLDFADIKVAKWQSRVTGLKVVWAQADGAPPPQGYARGLQIAESFCLNAKDPSSRGTSKSPRKYLTTQAAVAIFFFFFFDISLARADPRFTPAHTLEREFDISRISMMKFNGEAS